ncbi:hypothetical protein HK405_009260 [Cladochytrium tenue]|nr:hypothetical protein HK405_009260 [Cladochytrium tenue]
MAAERGGDAAHDGSVDDDFGALLGGPMAVVAPAGRPRGVDGVGESAAWRQPPLAPLPHEIVASVGGGATQHGSSCSSSVRAHEAGHGSHSVLFGGDGDDGNDDGGGGGGGDDDGFLRAALQRLGSSTSTLDIETAPALMEAAVAEEAAATGCAVGFGGFGRQPTPLPRKIMFVLSVVILSEPMSMTILFPFVYFMVKGFGIADEKDIGYYVGFIASSFSLAQLSDRIGRRPVLLFGLLGNTISVLMFGQSHSLAWAIGSRALCGFLNGNIGVAKCLLGEITDETNQAKAFSIFGLMWGIGLIIGPVLGGVLADPARQLPWLFGGCPFLLANPYFLPCLLSACVSLVGFGVGFFHLDETLPARRRREGYVAVPADEPAAEDTATTTAAATVGEGAVVVACGDGCGAAERRQSDDVDASRTSVATVYVGEVEPSSGSNYECGTAEKPTAKRPRSRLTSTSVAAVAAYATISFLNIIFDETFSIWSVTPPRDGGLGFTSLDIGTSLSLMGCATLFIQLVVYPTLSRWYSPLALFRTAVTIYPVVYLGFPCISTFVVGAEDDGAGARWLTWPALLANLMSRHFCNVLGFTSVMIMINNSADRNSLGLVNGVGQTSAALVRSIGPALGGTMWAWSLTNGREFPLNYWFVFVFLSGVSCVAAVGSQFLPEALNTPQQSSRFGSSRPGGGGGGRGDGSCEEVPLDIGGH